MRRSAWLASLLVLPLCGCTPTWVLTTALVERPQIVSASAPMPALLVPERRPAPATADSAGGRGASAPQPPVEDPVPDPAAELVAHAPVGSFVLGDSLSLTPGVGPVLTGMGYTVVAVQGQSASDYYLSSNLSSVAAQAAPAWVIELGTNNSGSPATVEQLPRWIDLIDSLRVKSQPVFWVVPYRPPAYGGGQGAYNLDEFGAELTRLAGERDWLTTLDFAGMARANPGWFEEDSAMHIHPDVDGQAAILELIAG